MWITASANYRYILDWIPLLPEQGNIPNLALRVWTESFSFLFLIFIKMDGLTYSDSTIVGILLMVVDNLDGILCYNLINNLIRQRVRQKCMNHVNSEPKGCETHLTQL
jgi:hypothetical protein